MNLKSLFALASVLVAFAGAPSVRATGADARGEMFIGKADAPITIIAYESLLCPHCASFHAGTLPKIKEAYVDKGLVKIVFREFPGDRENPWPAVPAMMARCLGKDQYFAAVDLMMREQDKWAPTQSTTFQKYRDDVFRYGQLAGMTREQFEACLRDNDMLRAMYERWREGLQKHGVRGTPHFVIGETTISGNRPYEEFEKVLKPLVEKLPKNN